MIHCQTGHQAVVGFPVCFNLAAWVFPPKFLAWSRWTPIQIVWPTVRLVGNIMVYSWVSTAPSVPMVLNLHPKLILQLRQVSAVIKAVGAGCYISWSWNRSDKVGEQRVSLVDCLSWLFLTINSQSTGSSGRRPASAATAPRPWQWAASRGGGVERLGVPQLGWHACPNLIIEYWPLARPWWRWAGVRRGGAGAISVRYVTWGHPSFCHTNWPLISISFIEKYVWCAVVVRGQVT